MRNETRLTVIVYFPPCTASLFRKSSAFSSDKVLFSSFLKSDWNTKTRPRQKTCERLPALLSCQPTWLEACCKTVVEIKISPCAVICVNHPQCRCHCRRRLQSFWENSPPSSPSSTACRSGLHRSDCTAVALPRPAGPEAPPGQTPLGVAAYLWALSSEYSFQHSWGHWRPRGGSPPACWGHWPGCRGFILNIKGWWK